MSESLASTPRFLVVHNPAAADHASVINAAITAAKAVNGIVEFEAGKVYRTSEVRVWRDTGTGDSGTRFIAGIEGNGALLKWPVDNTTVANKALLYLFDPHYRGNTGFYVRNLTLDCGNNAIATVFADRENPGEGLDGDGSSGQLETGDQACDFGLWLYGGENILIENVTCLRARLAGVRLQRLNSIPLRDVVLRQVMARFGATDGFDFLSTEPSPEPIQHVTFENCYAHMNQGKGFEIQHAENVRFIGCGAEKNKSWNVYVSDSTGTVDWIGGYTEKGNYDHLNPPSGFTESQGMKFEDGAGPVRILGGRLFGRLHYNRTGGEDFLVHSIGHTAWGLNSSNVPVNNTLADPIAANYVPTDEQHNIRDSVAISYHEIPEYFRYYSGISVAGSSPCTTKTAWQTELKNRLNIFLVLHDSDPTNPSHDPTDQTANITSRITAAINQSGNYSGTLAFEPGVVYLTKPVSITGVSAGGTRGAVVGVFGNGATLRAKSGGTVSDALLKVEFCHVSQDFENDLYGFFLSNLNLDADLKYKSALHLIKSKYFHISALDVARGREEGIRISGAASQDVYYGTFSTAQSHHNGVSSAVGDGFELSGANESGIRVANVGFYSCRSQFNQRRGVSVVDSTVTFADSVISSNRTFDIETKDVYSTDFVNCQVSGQLSSTTEIKVTNNNNTNGLHFLGGRLRNRYNNSLSTNVGTVDIGGSGSQVKHSMVHTQGTASLPIAQQAYGRRTSARAPPALPSERRLLQPVMKAAETDHSRSCPTDHRPADFQFRQPSRNSIHFTQARSL